MMNDIKRGPLGNTLVIHDFQKNPIDGKGWFYYIENLFIKNDLIPSKMSGKGSKTITFIRGKKQQEKENFKDIQTGVWIAALPTNVGTEMFDFLFSAHLHNTSPRGTCVLCWDDQISPFNQQSLETLAKDLFTYLEPAYGYGYQREFRYGPSFYPFGAIGGDDLPREEKSRISRWAHVYSCFDTDYHTGMLRDIYPINFLSQKHMDIEIEGQRLPDWIQSKPNHGELKQLNSDFWSWWIPKDNVENVKKSLITTGLLIAYKFQHGDK